LFKQDCDKDSEMWVVEFLHRKRFNHGKVKQYNRIREKSAYTRDEISQIAETYDKV